MNYEIGFVCDGGIFEIVDDGEKVVCCCWIVIVIVVVVVVVLIVVVILWVMKFVILVGGDMKVK